VLIPSLYATSPRTRSLRPVRVPSDQNTRWRLPFHFSLIKDKNFLSPYICQIDIYILDLKWNIRRDAIHVRQDFMYISFSFSPKLFTFLPLFEFDPSIHMGFLLNFFTMTHHIQLYSTHIKTTNIFIQNCLQICRNLYQLLNFFRQAHGRPYSHQEHKVFLFISLIFWVIPTIFHHNYINYTNFTFPPILVQEP